MTFTSWSVCVSLIAVLAYTTWRGPFIPLGSPEPTRGSYAMHFAIVAGILVVVAMVGRA